MLSGAEVKVNTATFKNDTVNIQNRDALYDIEDMHHSCGCGASFSCKISGSSQFIKRLFENKEIQFD